MGQLVNKTSFVWTEVLCTVSEDLWKKVAEALKGKLLSILEKSLISEYSSQVFCTKIENITIFTDNQQSKHLWPVS